MLYLVILHVRTQLSDKRANVSSVSESSMCTMTSGEADCMIQCPVQTNYPAPAASEPTRQTYPKPSRLGVYRVNERF